MYSYTDYLSNDESTNSTIEDIKSDVHQDYVMEKPLSLSKNRVIKSNFSNIIFNDYVHSVDSDNTLAEHFRQSSSYSFHSSSLSDLEKWKKDQDKL